MVKISQYTKDATSDPIKAADLFDMSNEDGGGGYDDSKKILVSEFTAYMNTVIENLYNSNGTLGGNREVTCGGFYVEFGGGNVIVRMNDESTDYAFIVQENGANERGRFGFDNTNDSGEIELTNLSGLFFSANNGDVYNLGKGAISTNTSFGVDVYSASITGVNNTSIGYNSGNVLTTANQNTFLGSNAGKAKLTGHRNVYLGYNAGMANTNSADNVYVGYNTGGGMTGTFNGSTFVGSGIAGASGTSSQSTIVGFQAGAVCVANFVTIMGTQAGNKLTNGHRNTFIGYTSGFNLTSGTDNVFLGYQSGYYETGNDKLFIDNQNRTDEATSRLESLIYGQFNSTASDQDLRFNAHVGINDTSTTHALSVDESVINGGLYKPLRLSCDGKLAFDMFGDSTNGNAFEMFNGDGTTKGLRFITGFTGQHNYLALEDDSNFGAGLTSPTARIHAKGTDDSSVKHAFKADGDTSTDMFTIRNDGLVAIGIAPGSANSRLHIEGFGNTSSTRAFKAVNSDNDTLIEVRDDGATIFASFTLATLPSVIAGGQIYVSDATGSSLTGSMCFSNGTVWIDVTTGAAVV